MLDLDANQIEVDLAEYAILQVELARIEFELDVEALFNADLHLDRLVDLGLLASVAYNEFLFLGDPIIRPVDNDGDVVAKLDDDAIVAFKLLLDTVELEIVRHIVSEGAGWLQVSHNLEECEVLVLVVSVLNDADELDPDTLMVNALILVQCDLDLALDVFSILKFKYRC